MGRRVKHETLTAVFPPLIDLHFFLAEPVDQAAKMTPGNIKPVGVAESQLFSCVQQTPNFIDGSITHGDTRVLFGARQDRFEEKPKRTIPI